ncbi:SnoaL-like domain-containing protein [Brenneria izadpanahii]|uniref:SnoaL-like domain-containing protein n=1 Tax=Brenneria izadpanahii TaxID=2722756 RepID=A0ABX7ULZ9_9GAMM|nr:nuclear transport factor 2 family protein [Brenneria izadpanahii]QTF06533.1 SnoaL-like domain-containing protein [Brenneria izadpanahii]
MPDYVVDTRIETVRDYFRKVDAKDPALLDLFTEDVEFFFPKFGAACGKAALQRFAERIARDAAKLTHDIDGLLFTVDGDRIVVEGREWGVTADGRSWPDGEISQGRFANIFEFDGPLIKRTFIYVDPDFTSEDRRRVALYRGEALAATPRDIASRYFERVAAFWAKPDDPQALAAILELFADEVDWDIPGNLEAVPWIGPRRDREAVGAFYRELTARLAPERFEVQRILADDDTAVALGELASRVHATGGLIETPFAFVLTVRDGRIVRYRMLEDSHAVAVAALGQSA